MEKELVELYQKTIPNQNLDLIPLEILCDTFGIDYERQYRNLDDDESYKGLFLKAANENVFGDKRKRGHLNKKGFTKWIFQLNPTYINDSQKETFIQYQNNLLDYLYENAIQQELVLKKVDFLKNKKENLYNKLYSESDDFVNYINLQSEIFKLGKENKIIQQKIVNSSQTIIQFN
jgi:hypothetical protein